MKKEEALKKAEAKKVIDPIKVEPKKVEIPKKPTTPVVDPKKITTPVVDPKKNLDPTKIKTDK